MGRPAVPSALVESKGNAFALRPRNFRGGGKITCLHACRLPSAGKHGADQCHWTVDGGQGADRRSVAPRGRSSIGAGGGRQPRGRRAAARVARLLRTDRSRGSRLGGKPSSARCAALSESVAASGNSGRTRYGVMEDRDGARRFRNFTGNRDHNSAAFSRLLCRPGAGSAPRGDFRPGKTARAPEHGRLQRNRCGGNAGTVRGSRRHSGCLLAGSGSPGARRVFRR